MKIAAVQHIDARQTAVEAVLQDGRRLAQAIPNFQLVTPLDEQHQRAVLTVAVGPLRGQYEGTFAISSPETAVWEITFNGHSTRGIFHGSGRIHLTSENEQTMICFSGDLAVAGQLANLPPRLVQANANAIVRRCLESVQRVLQPAPFTSQLEPQTPAWWKTAVPAALAAAGLILLSRLLNKRLK